LAYSHNKHDLGDAGKAASNNSKSLQKQRTFDRCSYWIDALIMNLLYQLSSTYKDKNA